jgi:hypothetical protein
MILVAFSLNIRTSSDSQMELSNSEVNSSGKWSTHPIIIHCPVQGEDKKRHISSSSEREM